MGRSRRREASTWASKWSLLVERNLLVFMFYILIFLQVKQGGRKGRGSVRDSSGGGGDARVIMR